MSGQSWQVRRVYGAQALEAISILREASLWTAGVFGRPVWAPESFTEDEHRVIAAAGEQVGGFEGAAMVACMRLQARDPIYWPDDQPGEALYLHKLAVRRASAGKGWTARMVAWAADECRAAGAPWLRLDTASDTKLPQHYAALGFRLVDDTPTYYDGMPVVRMEMPIKG